MERDFMGLSKVKDETSEEPIDAAPLRSNLAMQWSFSNKNNPSASTTIIPQFMCFQEKPKTGFDSLASTGLVSITTLESFDVNRKVYANTVQGAHQKNMIVVPEKQGGVSYTNNMSSVLPSSVSGSTMPPFGPNLIGPIKTKPFTGNSMNNPVVGSTELRNSPKISTAPAQLTIFYNGSVCVYDHVSPEKAQAIMLLAGNGLSSTSSATNQHVVVSPIQTSASVPKPSVVEGFVLNQPQQLKTATAATSNWPSPPPAVTSITSVSKLSGNNNVDTTAIKLGGGILVPSHEAEPLKAVVHPPIFASSDTVPQFRKKSLARFLEKRKERLVSSAPYGTKQSTPMIS